MLTLHRTTGKGRPCESVAVPAAVSPDRMRRAEHRSTRRIRRAEHKSLWATAHGKARSTSSRRTSQKTYLSQSACISRGEYPPGLRELGRCMESHGFLNARKVTSQYTFIPLRETGSSRLALRILRYLLFLCRQFFHNLIHFHETQNRKVKMKCHQVSAVDIYVC